MARFDLSREELETYRPDIPEPADFDAFWDRTLEENPFHPDAITVTPTTTPLTTLSVWDVVFPGYAGDPIHAWLVTPAGATGPLPTVVQFNGYGGGRGLPVDHLEWASAGFAHLFMDSRGQGGTWGRGGDTADPHGSGSADQGFMTRGIEHPDQHYYRRIYIDAHHAVEAAAHLPQCDATRIAVQGGSQGGALTIAAAALNPRVAAALPDVPFMCHFRRSVGMTDGQTPYQEVVRYLSVFREREDLVQHTLSYFDGVLLAKRARCAASFSTALMDDVCPPSTVFAARNWWGARVSNEEKAAPPPPSITVYPFNGHEGGESYRWLEEVDWLRSHFA